MTRAHDPVFFVFANTDRVSELRNASANIIHLPTIYRLRLGLKFYCIIQPLER